MGKGQKEECLSFSTFLYNYGRYHSNPINALIHVICIPLIMLSLLVFICHWTPMAEYEGYKFNPGALLLTTGFVVVYTMVDTVTGLAFAAWTFPGCYLCWEVTKATS